MGGRGASSSKAKNEIQSVYSYLEGRKSPYIGANTKAFDLAINNATNIKKYNRDTGNMDSATKTEIKDEVNRFGKGRMGYQMFKSGENEFTLHYSPNDFYSFTLKKGSTSKKTNRS